MTTHDEDRFDAAMRARYRAAADALPGPVRRQLMPALAAQSRAHGGHPLRWRVPAFAALASLTLALGLWWSMALAPGHDAATGGQAVAEAASPLTADNAGGDVLSRDPDFYAWLASDEARTLAME